MQNMMMDNDMFRPLAAQGSFTEHYRAFPVVMLEHRTGDKAEINYSGKSIESILFVLLRFGGLI